MKLSADIGLIDLSVALGPSVSEPVPVQIQYMDHFSGGKHLGQLLGIESESLPGGMAWASERVSAITHSGTHMDAPFHYAPDCAGKPSRTIDEMPLSWFFSSAVCLRFDPERAPWPISNEEFQAAEQASGRLVEPGEIVLFDTGASGYYGQPIYQERGRGISADVVRLLCERGVRVIGTDAWSLDPPISDMKSNLGESGLDTVWAAHYVGRDYEFCSLERLRNLDLLPSNGFLLCCFPIKVLRGSGGWVRAVAILGRDGKET